ncbi:hypothetical protein OKW24_004526 [Peribacillus simplex]|nr:hypothetical protein [Peribacillus simplex]
MQRTSHSKVFASLFLRDDYLSKVMLNNFQIICPALLDTVIEMPFGKSILLQGKETDVSSNILTFTNSFSSQ